MEAVNLLVHSLENAQVQPVIPMQSPDMLQTGTPNPQDGSIANVIRTLGDLQSSDPSRYVRLRSASALREISARSEQ